MSGLLLDVVLRAAESGSSESLGDAAGVGCLDVEPASWPVVLRAARDVGAWLDWLGGVDDGSGGTQVVALVQTEYEDVLVSTQLGADEDLESVREVFEGADWHERETAEMLGVRFVGGDHRPLLLPAGTPPPLRRGTPLERRLSTPWPGAREAGRRARVPGINKEWERP